MSSDGEQAYDATITPGPTLTSYELLRPDQFRGLPTITWRVKNLLPCTGVAFIYGASNCGKTFLALALAAAIAEGHSWFGLKCIEAPVVYMALEGAMIRKRTAAWEKHTKRQLPDNFRMVLGTPFELLSGVDINGLGKCVLEAVGPGSVIFIDTMARSTTGLDENSSKDMGSAIEAAERLARLVEGLVILVHHAGKNKESGMRGSSAMFAAAEGVIEVNAKAVKGSHGWRPAKLKDAESFGERLFNLESVHLDIDGDDVDITSCVVVWDQSAEAAKGEEYRVKGKNQQLVLDAIRLEIESGPRFSAPEGVPDDVRVFPRDAAIGLGAIELESVKGGVGLGRGRERAKEAIASLVKSGTLGAAGGGGKKAVVWIP